MPNAERETNESMAKSLSEEDAPVQGWSSLNHT